MAPTKHPTSFRLSDECLALIEQLAAALGISQAGVVEQAIRKFARAELPAQGGPAPESQKARGRARKGK
jgi:predicted transcriptional regulator